MSPVIKDPSFFEAPYNPIELLPGQIVREGGLGVDLRGQVDWTTILNIETAPYESGLVMVTADIRPGATRGGLYPSAWVSNLDIYWAEVCVTVLNAQIESIWFEGGLFQTSFNDDTGAPLDTPGPIYLPFARGEVPDHIVVQARAKRWGRTGVDGDGVNYYPPGDGAARFNSDEVFNVSAISRFRK